MRPVSRIFICFFLLAFLNIGNSSFGQAVRILPIGNSITFDFNSADQISPRPDGDRISYRYKLYQLLTAAGYNFDYVGSENAGNNYFHNEEMDDCAGLPNITDDQVAYLINTGYNGAAHQYEAPGPYLLYYPADIILLHIGTNALDESPNDVEDILDNIRTYDSDVIILVARIINRHVYSQMTTNFNDNVEAMVNLRGDDRIISVNIESGAGIDYNNDMFDNLHPNQTGYDKMGVKWFDAIDHLNSPPVISVIPDQVSTEGSAFSDLALDGYVTDSQDPDNLINWTSKLQPDSKLNASIDGNRVLHVSTNDNKWYGSEIIKLYAEDSGGGAFKKSDSIDVTYTIIKANEAPQITSIPDTVFDEDNNYSYSLIAQDNDGNTLTYSCQLKPNWLNFSSSTHTLSGRPSNSDVGVSNVILRVSDGILYDEQSFHLTVTNVNDLPVITSFPDTIVNAGKPYTYELTASDIDVGDALTFNAIYIPDWLTFSPNTGSALLYGAPVEENIGSQAIILKVSDGHADVLQGFTLKVMDPISLSSDRQKETYSIYPNPASEVLNFKVVRISDIRFSIYDITGALKQEVYARNTDELHINITSLPKGIYLIKALVNNVLISEKFTK
jgi:hypothetical protein